MSLKMNLVEQTNLKIHFRIAEKERTFFTNTK